MSIAIGIIQGYTMAFQGRNRSSTEGSGDRLSSISWQTGCYIVEKTRGTIKLDPETVKLIAEGEELC